MRQTAHSFAAATPRAIIGRIRATGSDPAAVIAEIRASLQARNERDATTIAAHEAMLNDHAMKLAALGLGGGGGTTIIEDAAYSTPFANWFRTGEGEDTIRAANATGDRRMINAALQEGTNSDGGYLAPTEWDRKISQSLVGLSPLRRLCTVQKTTTGAYSTLWKLSGPGTGWVGETASRPVTASPTFASVVFGHGEIYSNAAATQRILDDTSFNLEQWLANELDTEFAKQEAIAFLSGDGVNKPNGLLLHGTGGTFAAFHPGGALAVDPSGKADGLTADGLVDFTYKLPAPYRQNASWLMNSNTAAAVAKMKDGQGNYIWREGLIVGQPSTLLGRPVELDENMPSIAAGTTPIVFGDFRAGYVINDRFGTRILRDPYTIKPFVTFYATRRVGGGVKDPLALRILKIAAS